MVRRHVDVLQCRQRAEPVRQCTIQLVPIDVEFSARTHTRAHTRSGLRRAEIVLSRHARSLQRLKADELAHIREVVVGEDEVLEHHAVGEGVWYGATQLVV
jgi:hypothetical protein